MYTVFCMLNAVNPTYLVLMYVLDFTVLEYSYKVIGKYYVQTVFTPYTTDQRFISQLLMMFKFLKIKSTWLPFYVKG